mmetsp:Transcript_30985/g.92042  ORF Transcript_30985/g.92042 Transcript_30985/m.92042 type:complete len:214 (+) Transcript_30985:60-701(+)
MVRALGAFAVLLPVIVSAVAPTGLRHGHLALVKNSTNASAAAAVATEAPLSYEGKEALKLLLADLKAEGSFGMQVGRFVPYHNVSKDEKEFLPKCGDHVTKLVRTLHQSYTHAQLEHVLKQECDLEEEFPSSIQTGFKTVEACKEFATKLAEARFEEIDSGSQASYAAFCRAYYQHAYGAPPVQPTPAPVVKSGASHAAAGTTLLLALAAATL